MGCEVSAMDIEAITAALAPWRDLLEAGSWIAGIASGLFTALIFLEARSIRQVEWFSKTSANWQDFNRLIGDRDAAERWGDLKSGRVAWADVTQADLFLIYAFLNVLVFEYHARRRGLLNRRYATKSILDNVLYFNAVWDDLEPHLRTDGWPLDFIDEAHAHILKTRAATPGATSPFS
jgi:hypothetical protein